MSPRRHLSKTIKLASALLRMEYFRLMLTDKSAEAKEWYEHGKMMGKDADLIISLFEFDHYPIRHVDGGPDEPWNLTPMFIGEHRKKTATVDAPAMAKDRKIARAVAAHRAALVAKSQGEPKKPSRWGSRKLQSRNTFRRRP